ncbi:hypothetical protein [Mesorhizobium tianshanense]|uniref:hypothetical protein n=1 Tax=Mesorhizobium tianshanense TaxID=39844 RepID=UPI001ABF5284|nr:hypothetical protein [Mesorhizobium tianshanense]
MLAITHFECLVYFSIELATGNRSALCTVERYLHPLAESALHSRPRNGGILHPDSGLTVRQLFCEDEFLLLKSLVISETTSLPQGCILPA